MQDEIEMNTSIYNGEFINGSPEQEEAKRAARRERRANLPKFRLAEGERFYIPREKVIEAQRAYFLMLDEMKKGTVNADEEMRSFMESVLFESYKGEIYKLQEDYSIEGIHNDYVHAIKKGMTTPAMERSGLFRRRKPNYALRLCQKEAELEREMENAKHREDIARQEIFLYGEEVDTFEAVFDELKSTTLEGARKKGSEALVAALIGIQDAYEQCSIKMLVKMIDVLEVYISEYVRGRKRRKTAYGLTERLVECGKSEIEGRKARTSDITILRLISEILKHKRGVPELTAPQPEAGEAKAPWSICNMDLQVPEAYESQNASMYFVPPDEVRQHFASGQSETFEEIEGESGAELNELYEIEDEFYDDDDEEPEENEAVQNELEQQDGDEDEEED